MNTLEQVVLVKLNYEWTNLVNIIKYYDSSIWKSTYETIGQYLNEILDKEVSIASEYTIFDNIIRQTGDSRVFVLYMNLVSRYKDVFGLSSCLPMSLINTAFKKKKINVDSKFMKLNNILRNKDIEIDIENAVLYEELGDKDEENYEIYQCIISYIQSLYIFEIMCPVPEICDGDYSDDEKQ